MTVNEAPRSLLKSPYLLLAKSPPFFDRKNLTVWNCYVYSSTVSKRSHPPKSPKRAGNAGTDRTYRIEELAEAAELPVRTVRYYLQRGLLPAPEFRGPQTAYSRLHRLRLDAIRVLQERGLGLDAIARLLDALPVAHLTDLARGKTIPELGLHAGATGFPAPFLIEPARQLRTSGEPAYRNQGPASGTGELRRVFHLAPGLELHLADGASADTVRLARRLLRELSIEPELPGGPVP